MKRKVIIIIPAAVALALGIAGSASAHTPQHNATCQAGLSVSGTQYNGGKVTLQIGTSSVQHTFTGGSFSYTLPNPDKTIVEAWKIVIDANDGNEFDVTYQGNIPACQQTTTTQGSTTSTSTSTPTTSTTSTAPPASSTSTQPSPSTSPPSSAPSTPPTTEPPATTATSSPSSPSASDSVPAQAPPGSSSAPRTTSSPTSEPLVAVGAPPKPPTPQTPAGGLPATGTETTTAALLAGLVLAGGTGLALIARRRA